MEKLKLFICFICLFMLLTGCSLNKNKTDSSKESSNSDEGSVHLFSAEETEETTSQTESEEIGIVKKEETDSTNSSENQEIDQKIQKFLIDFGTKFVNYESINERNQSIKDFLTLACAEENGVYSEVNASFEAKGEVVNIYETMDGQDNFQYLILGKENVKGTNQTIVLLVDILTDKDSFKIQKMTVNYIKQAY